MRLKKSTTNRYSRHELSMRAKWTLRNSASYGYCRGEGGEGEGEGKEGEGEGRGKRERERGEGGEGKEGEALQTHTTDSPADELVFHSPSSRPSGREG